MSPCRCNSTSWRSH